MQIVKNLFDDLLVCPVHQEPFDSHLHVPFVLGCGHNLCMEAIIGIQEHSQNRLVFGSHPHTLKCPQCKVTKQYEDSRNKIQVCKNYALIQVIEKTTKMTLVRLDENLSKDLLSEIQKLSSDTSMVQKLFKQCELMIISKEKNLYKKCLSWTGHEENRGLFLKYIEESSKWSADVRKLIEPLLQKLKTRVELETQEKEEQKEEIQIEEDSNAHVEQQMHDREESDNLHESNDDETQSEDDVAFQNPLEEVEEDNEPIHLENLEDQEPVQAPQDLIRPIVQINDSIVPQNNN